MDDLENSKIGPGRKINKPASSNDSSIPFDDTPIPFDDSDDLSDTGISRTPVNLGASGTGKAAKKKVVSADRITGAKTFCTKLHEGSIEFIDERIKDWLTENPGIVIKRTNTATGMVTGKKIEPNIIVTVWY